MYWESKQNGNADCLPKLSSNARGNYYAARVSWPPHSSHLLRNCKMDKEGYHSQTTIDVH